MRTYMIDQYEFENSCSEESLKIHTAKRGGLHRSLASFAKALEVEEHLLSQPSPILFEKYEGKQEIRDHLEKFTNVTLPYPCTWDTYVLFDEWNDVLVLIEGHILYISYYWSTSA